MSTWTQIHPRSKYIRYRNHYCGKKHYQTNLLRRGKDLLIKARGNFTDKVEQDAYINLSVKYGLITLVNTKADLCEQMKEVDEECPLEGAKAFTKKVALPQEIPPVSCNRSPAMLAYGTDKLQS